MKKNAVRVELNEKKILDKVQNDKLGLFISHEWKRLINPFTPRRYGNLERNVVYRPFEIEYKSPYANKMYEGTEFNFRKEFNPHATHHWDKAAEQAGQKQKLLYSINNVYFKK